MQWPINFDEFIEIDENSEAFKEAIIRLGHEESQKLSYELSKTATPTEQFPDYGYQGDCTA